MPMLQCSMRLCSTRWYGQQALRSTFILPCYVFFGRPMRLPLSIFGIPFYILQCILIAGLMFGKRHMSYVASSSRCHCHVVRLSPFLPRDAMLARYMLWPCACLSVCLPVTSWCSTKTAQMLNGFSWFLAWRLPLTHLYTMLSIHCAVRKFE